MNERLQAIDAAIQFIEGHLRATITVADIAAASGYSLYHFIRTFNQTVHHTPYDYLMRRRLSQAAGELLSTDRRVIDIALDFQFNNHETFTRAFGRCFGMPPTQWREIGVSESRLLMPALDLGDLEYLSTTEFEPPHLVTLHETILAGWMTPLNDDPKTLPNLWRNLRGVLRGQPEKKGGRDFWGIRIQPQIPEGSAFYFAGIKIQEVESTPSVLVTKIIPAGDYLCLKQNNMAADLDAALTYLYHTFLPKSGYRLAEPLEIEHFGETREIFIPVKILKKQRRSE